MYAAPPPPSAEPPQHPVEAAAWTDTGLFREHNEDAHLIDERRGLYLVADGVGGHQAGEVAAALAITRLPALLDRAFGPSDRGDAIDTGLRSALADLNDLVRAEAASAPERRGMATTVVLVHLRGADAHLVHVGDSRGYLLRHGELSRLTEDHCYAAELAQAGVLSPAEALNHPQAHHITRAVGIADEVAPTIQRLDLEPGDRLLLCSDGITDLVADPAIAGILRRVGTARRCCRELVDAANRAGGHDNSSAIVVDIGR